MIEQTNNENNWIQQELNELNEHKQEYEQLPSMKFEENTIIEIKVLTDKPFDKWTDQSKTPVLVKKIIPVMHKDTKKNFWLNVKNPLYSEILKGLSKGINTFKIIQTGKGEETKYSMIKE